MSNENFGIIIKKFRSNNKMSMQELADILGVTKGTINMWENKGVVPRDDVLIKISKLLNVSIDTLLGNDRIDENSNPNSKLKYIQRNMNKLNDKQLEVAENLLKAVFDDIFDNERDDDDEDL